MKTRIKNIKSITSWSPKEDKLKIINDTNIVIENEKIFYIGKNKFSVDKEIDANGALITPGFIDSHTHPIFYNNRSEEFFLRTKGISYDEISRGGGGILSSIKSVREVSEEKLFNRSLQRINYFLKNGTTTIEAKSGYGLNTKNELKLLSVIKKLNEVSCLDLVPTFMGAHAVPQEYNKDTYINLICNEMIPAIAEKQLAEYCDVFCENGYFSIEDSKKILLKAKEYGMKIRLHADEFEDSGAANLAAELSAISADHLMAVSDIGIKSLAKRNVIATILPGTTFFLGKQSYANGRKIIDLGCGNGWATRKVHCEPLCKRAVGVDGASNMLVNARSRSSGEHYIQADAAVYDPGERFDLIHSMEFIYYLTHPREFMETAVNSWLNKGGRIIFGLDFYFENTESHTWPKKLKIPMLMLKEIEWVSYLKKNNLGYEYDKGNSKLKNLIIS